MDIANIKKLLRKTKLEKLIKKSKIIKR